MDHEISALFIWRVKVWGVWGERELQVKARTSDEAQKRALEIEPNAIKAVTYECIGVGL